MYFISGESDWRAVRLEKEEIATLADEYARWRNDNYTVTTLASSEQKIGHVGFKTLV